MEKPTEIQVVWVLHAGGVQLLRRYERPIFHVTLNVQNGVHLLLWAETENAIVVNEKRAPSRVWTAAHSLLVSAIFVNTVFIKVLLPSGRPCPLLKQEDLEPLIQPIFYGAHRASLLSAWNCLCRCPLRPIIETGRDTMQAEKLEALYHHPLCPSQQGNKTGLSGFEKRALPGFRNADMLLAAMLRPAVVASKPHAAQLARHRRGGDGLTSTLDNSRLWSATVVEVPRQTL